ncbi:MAG TPA: glutaminyl-peptide cyclotransferase [Anaerolineae bacterium]|nr:glutaminyl-peptide cyclotransferase [Anaerolineae bacterium]HNU04084.1 glutaminyl-peptide cyclotransferase [Anaerolineae bacterium]
MPRHRPSQRLLLPALLLSIGLAACQPAAPAAPAPAAAPQPALTAPPAPTAAAPTSAPTAAAPASTPTPAPTAQPAAPTPIDAPPTPAAQPSIYGYQVLNVFPHDPSAFTQGLVYQDGIFYEGTGLRGQSTLRQVDPATGQVLQGVRLPDQYFGEGIALLGDRLYQLTWQENTGFIYDKTSFELLGTWNYAGEGWGLTSDGQRLIMSDGSNELRFLDPAAMEELGRVAVVDGDGLPVTRLNELEWVEGEVWANVWQTDRIARIDPASGRLLGWIDLAGLLPEEDRAAQRVDVLNGIAYDAATGRLFVTGKWWPKLFEIQVAATP